jgi:uncharacterized membrane-anchored protein
MSRADLESTLRAAVAERLLPADAAVPAQDERPWPVVLLTALGAWLAVLPLIAVVFLVLGSLVRSGGGLYVIGLLLLSGAVAVLMARGVPLFVEQLAVPALLVGGAALGFGLFRDLPARGASMLLAAVAVGVACALPRSWLRVLLGAAAAVLAMLACAPGEWFWLGRMHAFWLAWHVCLALWFLAGVLQRRVLADGAAAPLAAAVESLRAGWLLATLAGLAWWSGMSFLVGASAAGAVGGLANELVHLSVSGWGGMVQPFGSVLLALGAALAGAGAWPTLRQPWCAGLAAVLAALAWFMPALGAVLLALALCATSGRWRLAGAAAVAAAWIVGAFYYQLHWPLATKAAVLLGAAAVLGALAWWARPAFPATAAPCMAPLREPRLLGGLGLGLAAVLAVANIGIWQKESLIAHGQPVYVELAPADPRSLMQGDFMRLNYRLPPAVDSQLDGLLGTHRPRVVARRDGRGVATVLRLHTGAPLAADELLIELTPKDGRWVLVSDAWFFKEGEAARWEPARYGEFRVGADGKALLVGLKGADLKPL